MSQDPPYLDWLHLPAHVVPESLWVSLHDAELIGVRSDLVARTVVLELDVHHLRTFHALGEETHFLLTLHAVESVRAATSVSPAEPPSFRGISLEEQFRLTAAYQLTWREESVGWKDFVAAFPTNRLDISAAEIARDARTLTIQFQGSLTGDTYNDSYFSVSIRAGSLTIQQSNGPTLTLKQFIQLGEDYWDAFSRRAQLRSTETTAPRTPE